MNLAMAFNYFANSLWQAPLLAFCCWCALRLARASARVQYVVWIAALLLSVGLPMRGASPGVDVAVEVSGGDVVAAGAFLHPVPARALPFYAVRITPRTRDLLAELYLLMTLVCLGRLLMSYVTLRRLARASTVPSYDEPLRAALMYAGLAPEQVRVLPPAYGMPMVAGILRPLVLLPEPLLTADAVALRAVLAHEAAHMRRRDTLTNLLLRGMALPVAYHLATLLMHRHIGHARELLCDAVAAESLPSTNAYAQVLLGLARQLIRTGGDVPRSTVGLFERTSKPLLEERIMNLIAPPAPLRTASRALRVSAAAVLLGTAVTAAVLVHLSPTVLAGEQASPTGASAAALPPQQGDGVKPAVVTGQATNSVPAIDAQTIEQTLQQAAAQLRTAGSQSRNAGVDTSALRQRLAETEKRLNSPQFKQQIADATAVAQRVAKQSETDPALREAIRRQLDSPKLKQQIADATAEARNLIRQGENDPVLRDAVRKQLNSPEFKRQMAEARDAAMRVQAAAPTLMAEAGAHALPAGPPASGGMASAQQPGAARVSAGVMAGALKNKVTPVYPPEAKAAGITGAVVMHALIGEDGTVTQLDVISGPQELRSSALEAVRQWVYQPYLLNGQPTEVETTVTVTYSMGG